MSTQRIFNAAIILHGGESYARELRSGLLQRVFGETVVALRVYDTDQMVPLIVARDQPMEHGPINLAQPPTVATLLERRTYGRVALAPALQMALDELPADQPGIVTIISDFQITDAEQFIALIDELALSPRQVFIKLVFATGDQDGDDKLPQMLDDRHMGASDKVDAVYATHFGGDEHEPVREHFGREVDVLVRQIERAARRR